MMKVLFKDRWLVVSFDELQETRSWAIYGGPRRFTKQVAWYQVQKGDLKLSVDAKEFAKNIFTQNNLSDAVGMLTGAQVRNYVDVEMRDEDFTVHSFATVGISNALRVGDPASQLAAIGTINLLCAISVPLTDEAFLEALSIASEARTTAVMESGVLSSQTGLPATGTGTDCIVIAASLKSPPAVFKYAGKHTRLGSLIGKTVLEAVGRGLKQHLDPKVSLLGGSYG